MYNLSCDICITFKIIIKTTTTNKQKNVDVSIAKGTGEGVRHRKRNPMYFWHFTANHNYLFRLQQLTLRSTCNCVYVCVYMLSKFRDLKTMSGLE